MRKPLGKQVRGEKARQSVDCSLGRCVGIVDEFPTPIEPVAETVAGACRIAIEEREQAWENPLDLVLKGAVLLRHDPPAATTRACRCLRRSRRRRYPSAHPYSSCMVCTCQSSDASPPTATTSSIQGCMAAPGSAG